MIPWRFQEFSQLPSTSDYCIERAKAGEPEGLAIFAHQQSAGRGSRGRSWSSPPGNVALSILIRPDITPKQSSIFPLLAGNAVSQALKSHLPPSTSPMLKWPNDVLLNGEKCAGLLIDAVPAANRIEWLVIGIGINVAYAPVLPGRNTTCLTAHGASADALTVAQTVLTRLAYWLNHYERNGPMEVLKSWTAHAHPIGTPLTVTTPNLSKTGTFAGLSPTGQLLLSTENRIETFQTGEILLSP